jgi:Predicted dinucleotide-utilizing enzyme
MGRKVGKAGLLLLWSGLLLGMGIWICKVFIKKDKLNTENDSIVSPKRFEVGFQILNNWIKIKNAGRDLKTYFIDNEISTVAIYGMGALGERLYEELSNTEIKVVYAIDRMAEKKGFEGLRIVSADDVLEDVDVIIVTPVQDYDNIEKMLEMKTDANIISLEDIVNYCSWKNF